MIVWLFQEPVLTTQDLPEMLRYTDNPPEGLHKLEKVGLNKKGIEPLQLRRGWSQMNVIAQQLLYTLNHNIVATHPFANQLSVAFMSSN